jgi:hypothetical protein
VPTCHTRSRARAASGRRQAVEAQVRVRFVGDDRRARPEDRDLARDGHGLAPRVRHAGHRVHARDLVQAEHGTRADRANAIERRGVALRVDGDARAGPRQQIERDRDGLLRAARDDDAVGVDVHAAGAEAVGDPGAHRGVPFGPPVLERGAVRGAERGAERLRDAASREHLLGGEPAAEREYT